MDIKERAKAEFGNLKGRVDANKDGNVSGAEAQRFAEDEIAKHPWRAVAIIAVLTALAVGAYFAITR